MIAKNTDYANDIMNKCSILYCMKNESMQKTCMCWGFSCGNGWLSIIDEMSCRLEALNLIYYPKYKVRIQMDQVKEKFGTLRAYFSVICEDTERTNEQEAIITALNSQADEIVRWAENRCYDTCEDCGSQIGTEWSPRCTTVGWITYICDTCAVKRNSIYFKNGEKWQGNTRIMTKDEVDAERRAREAKFEDENDDDSEVGLTMH